MSDTQPTPEKAVASPDGNALYAPARALAQKMLNIEQDPDIISVFSIARAHGYKTSSKFWHDELQALVQSLLAYDRQKEEFDRANGAGSDSAPAPAKAPVTAPDAE